MPEESGSAGHIVLAGVSDGFFALAKVDQTGALVSTSGAGGVLIFFDGFESGDTGAWSATEGP